MKSSQSPLFYRVIVVTSLIFLAILVSISLMMGVRIQNELEKEAKSKGLAIAQSISDAGVELILNSDAATLQSKIDEYLSIKGVSYIIVRDSNLDVIAHTFVPVIPDLLHQKYQPVLSKEDWVKRPIFLTFNEDGAPHALDVTVPILFGEVGAVHVGMDLDLILESIGELIIYMIAIFLVLFLIGVLTLKVVMGRISEPLRKLMRYVSALSTHHFESQHPHRDTILAIPARHRDEVGELSTTLLAMEDHLISSRRELETTISAKQQIESELQIATNIQMSMLPKEDALSGNDQFSLKGFMKPAKEVGGDFYDMFMRSPNELCLVVGDVSGKGSPAALFMSMTLTLLRAVTHQMHDLSDVVAYVNKYLCEHNDHFLFVTLWIGVFNIQTGELTYVNAGHNSPFVVTDNKVETLELTDGIVLAFDSTAYFASQTIHVSPESKLCIYTDGLSEAMSPTDECYGEDRMVQQLIQSSNQDVSIMLNSVIDDIETFADTAPQHDDMTVLMMHYHPKDMEIPNPFKVHFINDISEIAKLHMVVERYADTHQLTQAMAMNVNVVLEELLSNVIFYGYQDHDEHLIYVTFDYSAEELSVIIEDDGVPFNPLEQEDVDMSTSLEDTDIGGLGIHFVKSLTKSAVYSREGAQNKLVLVFTQNKEASND